MRRSASTRHCRRGSGGDQHQPTTAVKTAGLRAPPFGCCLLFSTGVRGRWGYRGCSPRSAPERRAKVPTALFLPIQPVLRPGRGLGCASPTLPGVSHN